VGYWTPRLILKILSIKQPGELGRSRTLVFQNVLHVGFRPGKRISDLDLISVPLSHTKQRQIRASDGRRPGSENTMVADVFVGV
jgi:hypothetical protein